MEYNSSYGGRVVFACSWGYRLRGPPGLECEQDGKWSGEIPHCVRKSGLTIIYFTLDLVSIALIVPFLSHLSKIFLDDVQLYWLSNVYTITIFAKFITAIYCPDPLVPENGRLLSTMSKDGKYPVGDLIMYACEDGLEIVGESSIVCTENGFWSHPPPFCLPPSEIKKADTIYIDNTTLVNFEE